MIDLSKLISASVKWVFVLRCKQVSQKLLSMVMDHIHAICQKGE